MSQNPQENPVPPEPAADAPAQGSAALEFAEAFGTALLNVDLYGIHHRISITWLERSFESLMTALGAAKRVDIGVTEDDTLVVDGLAVETRNSRIVALVRRLRALRISGFAFKAGMDAEEFIKLVTYLTAARGAADSQESGEKALMEAGFTHVSPTRVVMMQVTESEEAAAAAEAGKGEARAGENVEQILAFLKGSLGPDAPAAREAVAKTAMDAAALAELIMQATSLLQAGPDATAGESLGNIVVGCLRRTFDALNQSPASRTQKGKRDIKRTLAVLEDKILERLREYAKEGFEPAAAEVSAEIEEMREEMDIGGLVAQYMKSRRAADEREKSLLRVIGRGAGGSEEQAELRERLVSEGLAPEGWHELVVKSETARQGEKLPTPGGDGANSTLSVLVGQLARLMEGAASPETVELAIARVQREAEAAATRTARKIDALAARKEGSRADEDQRREFLVLLREIVQELCQPLSVINATVQLLSTSRLGALNGPQRQAIALAVESGDRLYFLINRLIEVSGVPSDLNPDTPTIDSIYGKGREASGQGTGSSSG